MPIHVRPASPDDLPAILGLIRDLAEYERALTEVRATEDQLRVGLFGAEARAWCLIAEVDGQTVGFALWFLHFSTWLGEPGMYLEDLFVRPEARGRGAGLALLRALAAICVDRGYERFEWSVLDWNAPARGFYESLGAEPQAEWVRYRLSGPPLRALAGRHLSET